MAVREEGRAAPETVPLYHRQTCTRCALSRTRKTIVWGVGAVPAQIMVVGRGPGEAEDLHGLPFLGAPGKLLRLVWREAQVPIQRMFLTLATKCYAQHDVVTQGEAQACFPFLEQEVREANPAVIVTLGGFAHQAVTGEAWTPTGPFLSRVTLAESERPVFGTFHPSAYMRAAPGRLRENMMQRMIDDWRLIAMTWGEPHS